MIWKITIYQLMHNKQEKYFHMTDETPFENYRRVTLRHEGAPPTR